MIQVCNKGNLHLYYRYFPLPSKRLVGLHRFFWAYRVTVSVGGSGQALVAMSLHKAVDL